MLINCSNFATLVVMGKSSCPQGLWESFKNVKFLWVFVLILVFPSFPKRVMAQPVGTGTVATMDQAIAILNMARLNYQKVQDYECLLVKQERVNGILFPESMVTMRGRCKPLSLYLRWEGTGPDKGMEVSYVEGRNQGMMRVRPPGLLGVLGFWSVSTRDPRVFEKNRHSITEAGLGTLLETTSHYWEMERRLDRTEVHISDDQIGGRICTRIETIHPDRNAGPYYGYRCVLWIDKTTLLPLGAEMYDWPRIGGNKNGDLLESYRYLNLRFNIGLGDSAFVR